MAYNYFNQPAQPHNLPQYQTNQMFPQPSGNVYTINSPSELTNIPVGVGLTVALCLPENMLYLKSIQNGNPVIWSYRLSSSETSGNTSAAAQDVSTDNKKYTEELENLNSRLSRLEKNWEVAFDERFKSYSINGND